MHISANDLLHSPEIQQVIVHQKQEKWVHQVSEASLTMLDVCSISKDVVLLVKEQLLDLQFTLRRKIFSQPNINAKIAAYNHYRKKLKKETLKCLRTLKGMRNESVVTSDISTIDQKLVVVMEVLREVRVTTLTIVESLLSLISIPWLDQKSSKGSLRSKFFSSGDQSMYEICDEMALQSANKRLEAVEIAIEYLEVELECIFRRLIQTRVSLLNILTS
ncbi:uncharacterized protein LOC110615393 [Manihot esculenta]|nr:uncharacterized protein LOC110615393 [Manihot esculenta]